MQILWTDLAWEDYLSWQASDFQKLERINFLIRDIQRSPFKGIGKPEPLKFDLAGKWSRRIDNEHRLVYSINGKPANPKNKTNEQMLIIYQCKYHY